MTGEQTAIFSRRLTALRSALKPKRCDAFITSHAASLRYLCGYTGSNGLLIVSPSSSLFLTDFRYREMMQTEVAAGRKRIAKGSLIQFAVKTGAVDGLRRIAFEKDHLTVASFETVRACIGPKRVILTSGIVESLRAVKDNTELQSLTAAFDISDKVFRHVLGIVRPGMTELELSAEISYKHKQLGAENDSFDVIVASGIRGALPHGTATDKKLAPREFITLDFGCLYRGYHSDMTRTICLGRPTPEMKNVYAIVKDAQQRGCDRVRSGVKAKTVDAAARRTIAAKGYGKFFGHSLGHGVGLDIHELPRIAPKSSDILRNGNVVTIEPGIYLPGRFGIRIEDTVIVRDHGCEVLTASPKELIII
ncbi:MAG: aminopeptidase P family protein [Bacteroidetes bacterium]|nr:aminopeptidase P family protein [Bacteroidota bacterium]